MAGPAFGIGFLELLILLFGGGMMGTPPGDHDPALLKCPPSECVAFVEWADRGAGQAGAPGIDGLIAEPEIREFAKKLEDAIVQQIETSAARGSEQQKVIGAVVPPVIAKLLNHAGCFYVSHDPNAAAEVEIPPGVRLPIPGGLRFTLIVNAGNDAEEIAGKLQQIVEQFPEEIRKKDLNHQPFPNLPAGISLMLHRHEKYLVLGFGEGSIDAAIAGLKGEVKGLASEERYLASMKRVEMSRVASQMWIDAKRVIELASGVAAPQGMDLNSMAASLGLDKLDSIASVNGIVDGQLRTRTFLATGGSTRGVLVLAAGRGMKSADFEQIPADADFVAAFSIDPQRLLETAQQLAAIGGERSKEQFERVIKDIELNIDATFDGQIFPGFGNVVVVHDSPSQGGVLVTNLVASLEVLDRNKAYLAYTGALDFLQGTFAEGEAGPPRGTALKKETFMEETIWFVNAIGDSRFIFAPSFCMTENRLLIAVHPQALKAHLRFLKTKQSTFAEKLGKDVPVPEGELFFASYADTKSLVRYLYSFLPYVAQPVLSQMQREGVNLDVYDIPSAPTIFPYLQNAFSTAVRTREGLLFESQSPLPIPAAGSMLPFAVPMIGMGIRSIGLTGPPGPSIATPERREAAAGVD